MRAVALTGIRKIKLIDVETPEITNPDDVLIKVHSVGICGSDIHYYNEGNIGSQVVEYPWIVGHEAAGEVVKVGSNVKKLVPGDKIAIEPTIYCGKCSQCLADRRHTCLNQKFLGCPGQIPGCMSEYYKLPERCCFKVNDDLPFELAILAEPLSIGIYAVDLYHNQLQNKNIGILGLGPIGQSVLAVCIKQEVNKIFVTDKLEDRLKIAEKTGVTWTGNPDEVDIVGNIAEQEPELLDVVFECCGKQEAVDQAIELLKPGGTIMMIGIPSVQNISTNMDLMRRKEIRFQNVRRQNNCFEKAIRMIEEDTDYFQMLVTHKIPLSEAGKGFELVRNYKDNVMKAYVQPWN